MSQYWVVGAMFGGKDDQLESFIRRGYWYCWDPYKDRENSIPEAVQRLFVKIEVGDRIAVKKMLGMGSSNIAMRALGIVTDIDHNEWRVYVSWIVPNVERQVPIKGCMGSLHGPFDPSAWRDNVFTI